MSAYSVLRYHGYMATNVTFQQHKVSREERCATLGRHEGYRGCTIWFTGLSGAGKTTISFGLEKTLIQLGIPCYGLDGDNIRHGLCKNLGFKSDDRTENIRRVAEVAKLFADMGVITLASFISPFSADRAEARRIHESEGIKFFEVYVSTPLNVCEARDPKQLYKKARSGLLRGFTGIDSAYEAPEKPDLLLNASTDNETDSVQSVLHFLYEQGILPEKAMHQLCGQPVRELFVENNAEKDDLIVAAAHMPKIDLTLVDLQWLQVLAEGWASPLSGFMRERQYLQSLHHGQLFDLKMSFSALDKTFQNNSKDSIVNETEHAEHADQNINENKFPLLEPINQSIPIVLPIGDAQKSALYRNERLTNRIALHFGEKLVAILCDPEVFPHRKEERIHRQFGCSDDRHPTVKMIMDSGDWLLGGDLKVLERITYDDGLDDYRKTPLELRKIFAALSCDAVFAFQLRNPIHNGHALLMRETRAKLLCRYRNPILLLHPLGGWTKNDDVPLSVRIAQHKAVLEAGVLETNWTVLSIFPSPMLYAGPTEVQWHARARLACGANAYIVGRDPAGIQHPETCDYLYEPTHGAKVLSMAPGLPNLEIIPFRVAAYDKTKKKMDFFDPARKENFQFISGTAMRNYARSNQQPPEGFMVPAAWQVLASHYAKASDENDEKRGVA